MCFFYRYTNGGQHIYQQQHYPQPNYQQQQHRYSRNFVDKPTPPPTAYQDNPFRSNDGESVVNLFLNNSYYPRYNNNNNNCAAPLLANPYDQKPDAYCSEVLPGRIEDLQSPVPLSEPTIYEQRQQEGSGETQEFTRSLACVASTREKIRSLRKSFLEAEPEPVKLNKPKANKYLAGPNKFRRSSSTPSANNNTEEVADNSVVEKKNKLNMEYTTESQTADDLNNGNKQSDEIPYEINMNSNELISSNAIAIDSYDVSVPNEYNSTVARKESTDDTINIIRAQLPSAIHAEVVSVRADDESASSSSSDDDEDISEASTNIMVNIKPVQQQMDGSPQESSESEGQAEKITPRLEAPPQKQNIWGAGNRQRSFDRSDEEQPQQPFYDDGVKEESLSNDQPDSITSKAQSEYFPSEADFSFSRLQTTASTKRQIRDQFEPFHTSSPRQEQQQQYMTQEQSSDMIQQNQWMDFDRNFKDTALTAYKESVVASAANVPGASTSANQGEKDNTKAKKKTGLFSFFKKSKKKSHDDFIHIEPRQLQGINDDDQNDSDDANNDHIMPDLYGDQSPRFHVLSEPRENEGIAIGNTENASISVQRALFEAESQRNQSSSYFQVPEEILDLSQSPKLSSLSPGNLNLPDCVPVQNDLVERGMSAVTTMNTSFQEAMFSHPQYDQQLQDDQMPQEMMVEGSYFHSQLQDQERELDDQQMHREILDFGEQFIEGDTDLDQAFELRQSRTLERKLSMSKPTNLDDLLSGEEEAKDDHNQLSSHQKDQNTGNQDFLKLLNQPNAWEEIASRPPVVIPSTPVPPMPASHDIPESERTQEIDIDALLGGDYSDEEEGVVEEEDSYEMERLTRENTYKNKDCYKLPAPAPTYTTAGDIYPEHKVYTFNGETTFSASPEFSYMESFTASYIENNVNEGQEQYNTQTSHNAYNDVVDNNTIKIVHNIQNDTESSEQHHQPGNINMKSQQERLIAELSNKQIEIGISNAMAKPAEDEYNDDHILDDSFRIEEKRLEEEQRMLSSANLVLQEQLQAKEIERLQAEKQIDVSIAVVAASPVDALDDKLQDKGKSKPKSLFNFDGFKRKQKDGAVVSEETGDKKVTKDAYEQPKSVMMDRPRSMPKQKAKSGFSFFSSKDKKSSTHAVEVVNDVPSKPAASTDNNPPPLFSKPKVSLFSKPNKKLNTLDAGEASVQTNHEAPNPSKNLAEDIVTELMKSSANFSDAAAEEHVSPVVEQANDDHPDTIVVPDDNQQEAFSRSSNRSSVRQTKNKSKKSKNEEKENEPDTGGFSQQKRTESKSRFSIRMPKKKSKDKDTLGSGGNTNDHLNTATKNDDAERSRSTTPSQSRPGSRMNKEKSSGSSFGDLFGLRSSKRQSKSVERPKSIVSAADLSAKNSQQKRMISRPISMENPYNKQEKSDAVSPPKQSLSNFFSHDQSHSPLPILDSPHTEPIDLDVSQDSSNRSTSRQFIPKSTSMPLSSSINESGLPNRLSKEVTPPRDINQVGLPVPEVLSSAITSSLTHQYPPSSLNSSFSTAPPTSAGYNHNVSQHRAPSSLNTSYDNYREMPSLPSYPPPSSNPAEQMPPFQPNQQKQENLNLSGSSVGPVGGVGAGSRRQTGRQSGRFRRGGGGAVGGSHNNSFNTTNTSSMLNSSFISQGSSNDAQHRSGNDAQYRFMNSLIEAPPAGAHQDVTLAARLPGQSSRNNSQLDPYNRNKFASVGRLEGARLIAAADSNAGEQSVLSPAKSEESVVIRESVNVRRRRAGGNKKSGECSVM